VGLCRRVRGAIWLTCYSVLNLLAQPENPLSEDEVHDALNDDGCSVGQSQRIRLWNPTDLGEYDDREDDGGAPSTGLTRHTAVTIIRAIPMPAVTQAIRSVESFFIRATLSDQTPETARVATVMSIGVDCRSVLVT
jgi:hypothetical protein